MEALWGSLIILIGLLIFIAATMKSNFIVYRLLVLRSKILWGDNVHRFHQIVSILMIIFGIFYAFKIIK